MAQTTPALASMKQTQELTQEIQKLDLELQEKKKKLIALQQSEIEKLIYSFISDIEKMNFDKVTVKKLLIEKLTRKSKKRA